MKFFIIGGSGLLGYKIVKLAAEKHETFFTYNFRQVSVEGATAIKMDKCNRTETFDIIRKVKPDVVIDTAALHNVDYCETHPEEAWKVNVEGTKNIVDACKEINAKIIFVSTDYVFDGKKGFYNEEDSPNPLNYYAKTKLEAEKIVKEAGIPFIVARPSVIYGWNPSETKGLKSSSGKSMNFVIWTLMKLKNKEKIKIVTDQYSSPTLADNLAEALVTMALSDKQGVYHTAGKTCLNRYDFALKIAEIFGMDRNLIAPVTSDVFKQIAKRPKKCCLDVSKAERDFKIKFLTVDEGLLKMKVQQREQGSVME